MTLEEGEVSARPGQDNSRLQRAADFFVLSERLDLRQHVFANLQQPAPPIDQIAVDHSRELGVIRKKADVHRLLTLSG